MDSSLTKWLKYLIVVIMLFLMGLLFYLFYCKCYREKAGGPVEGSESQSPLNTGKVDPKQVKGEEYPPFTMKEDGRNEDKARIVPTGPIRGTMQPENKPVQLAKIAKDGSGAPSGGTAVPDPVVFSEYTPATTVAVANVPPDMSAAQNGNVVLLTVNTAAGLSLDGGVTFTALNPATMFPSAPTTDASGNLLDGGLCCDQVVQYSPQIDRFIWLMQFWGAGCNGKCGTNKFRIASASTQDMINSNGTLWTYWDFPSGAFGLTNLLDYPDLALGNNFLYVSIDAAPSTGLLVTRMSLSEIQAGGSLGYGYTNVTDGGPAYGGHLAQNTGDEIFWAGHNSNSQMRVFSLKESENNYFSRDININSWQNGTISNNTPGGTNWLAMSNGFPGSSVLGAARRGNEVWFAWTAAAGGGFINPHVQVVKLGLPSYNVIEQMQIWNDEYAFAYPAFATNSDNEVGISLAWGGRNYYGNHAVGMMGDFIVWYPELSETAITRWGDYVSCRRANPQTRMFAASGYAVLNNPPPATGWHFDPYYILFGRNSVVNPGTDVK